jgi:hypothetical protein
MNDAALLKVVMDEEPSAPRFAFGEMSQGHLIFRPLQVPRPLRLVASKETVTCQNP